MKLVINILKGIVVLGIISLITSLWLPVGQSFRLIFGGVFLLFIPGLCWSYVFLNNDRTHPIERFTIAICFSLAIVPLIIYLCSKTGIRINALSIIIETLVIILLAIAILFTKANKSRQLFLRHRKT